MKLLKNWTRSVPDGSPATQISAGTSENADPLPNLIDTWGRIMKEKFMVPQLIRTGTTLVSEVGK